MSDAWKDKDGRVALFRYVYHAGDLETASHPARYAQRHPRFAPLRTPPKYPLQVLASDSELHYAEAGARPHQRRWRVPATGHRTEREDPPLTRHERYAAAPWPG